MNYLDLFSGVGGFHLGLQQAGFKFNKVYHSEVDKYAEEIYTKHFPESIGLGDVTKIKSEQLGKIDFITFGFPCQDLSIAGKRKGLSGRKSNLFFEAIRIIRELQPEIFIFENVKGLFSSNGGKDFETVLRTIADFGLYECEWQLLNTKWFLPQNRERIYFIGHLPEKGEQKIFPIGENFKRNRKTRKKQSQNGVSLSSGYSKMRGQGTLVQYSKSSQDTKLSPLNGNSQSLNSGHFNQPKIQLKDKGTIRRLTPIECERLQGFPDDWTKGISDTQRYKCLGNAVSVPVVKEIGIKLNEIRQNR